MRRTEEDYLTTLAVAGLALLITLEDLANKHDLTPRDCLGLLAMADLEWSREYGFGLKDWLELHKAQAKQAREVLK